MKKMACITLAVLMVVFLGACGISQEDYDAACAERDRLAAENEQQAAKIAELEAQIEELTAVPDFDFDAYAAAAVQYCNDAYAVLEVTGKLLDYEIGWLETSLKIGGSGSPEKAYAAAMDYLEKNGVSDEAAYNALCDTAGQEGADLLTTEVYGADAEAVRDCVKTMNDNLTRVENLSIRPNLSPDELTAQGKECLQTIIGCIDQVTFLINK